MPPQRTISSSIVKHLKNRNGVASPCRTTCTVCGDAPCYAFLSIQLYIPLWRLTAIATIAVCLNIRHNFFQRTQPLARADCHGLHLALRSTPIRGMPPALHRTAEYPYPPISLGVATTHNTSALSAATVSTASSSPNASAKTMRRPKTSASPSAPSLTAPCHLLPHPTRRCASAPSPGTSSPRIPATPSRSAAVFCPYGRSASPPLPTSSSSPYPGSGRQNLAPRHRMPRR